MGLTNRWLLIAIAVLCYQPRCAPQGFQVDSSIMDARGGYSTKWDSIQDRLLIYRDTTASADPAARIFKNDGTSISIYPLMDLPESWYIDVWGVAATPEGGVVLAAIVGYSPRAVKPPQLKSLLLTYDEAGKLTKVWHVNPYHHHLVAVDRAGNVFALGDSNLNAPYPLVVKYSPTGTVLREFLSSAIFPNGDAALSNGSPSGDSDMFMRGEQLFAWIGSTQDLFRFSLAGDLLGRTSLTNALNGLAAATGNDHTRVRFLTTADQGEVIAQVQLWPKRATDPVRSVMIGVSADGSNARLLSSPPNPALFLGRTGHGKLVFLEPQPGNKGGTISEY